jgi:hypothetical protein
VPPPLAPALPSLASAIARLGVLHFAAAADGVPAAVVAAPPRFFLVVHAENVLLGEGSGDFGNGLGFMLPHFGRFEGGKGLASEGLSARPGHAGNAVQAFVGFPTPRNGDKVDQALLEVQPAQIKTPAVLPPVSDALVATDAGVDVPRAASGTARRADSIEREPVAAVSLWRSVLAELPLPLRSGPIAELLAPDTAALDGALRQFLAGLDACAEELTAVPASAGLTPWVWATTLGVLGGELLRQQLQGAAPPAAAPEVASARSSGIRHRPGPPSA